MLIDSSHRRWIVGSAIVAVAALTFYLVQHGLTPGGLSGGSRVGLIYGFAGSGLMIFAGLLSMHRRLVRVAWLPRRSWMLKGHIWLGLLSAVFILCHAGFRWGGFLETVLWIVLGSILVSGIFGLVVQNTIPRLLTVRIAEETPYEQMPHVCARILQRADRIIDSLCPEKSSVPPNKAAGSPLTPDVQKDLRNYYEDEIRPYLIGPNKRTAKGKRIRHPREAIQRLVAAPGLTEAVAALSELESLCVHRQQIMLQEQLHHWLHLWLLLHVPLSVALLVLGLAHAIVSLYY